MLEDIDSAMLQHAACIGSQLLVVLAIFGEVVYNYRGIPISPYLCDDIIVGHSMIPRITTRSSTQQDAGR